MSLFSKLSIVLAVCLFIATADIFIFLTVLI